jgi:acetyl-CoA C-acetyltransferase
MSPDPSSSPRKSGAKSLGIFLGASTRTPIGKFGGALKKLTAPELATHALRACLSRKGAAQEPEFVFLGHARQAGAGPNPARQAALGAGLSETTPALTLNQACASGMTAIFAGLDRITLGRSNTVACGGVESMSNTPYLLTQARWGQRLGHGEVVDGMRKDGFFCPMAQMLMGETVDRYLASEIGIQRAEQDAYALESQTRANLAWQKGHFAQEIAPLPGILDRDEHLRADTTLDQLAKLAPVFDPKTGTVTAGNSSGITDGAAFVLLSRDRWDRAELEVIDYHTVALDPKRMGLGPVQATTELLERNSLSIADLEAVELNEAFAAQVLACQRVLKIPSEKLNARGGSIALGHPIGASGARITVTLSHRLQGKPGALGLATLCVSGGMGVALLVGSLR